MGRLAMVLCLSSTAAATAARTSGSVPACPPLRGNVTVKVPDIYPESADFAFSTCKFYLGSLNNGSLVEWDPYTSMGEIIEIPEVGHNPDFFLCGVDYSHATGTIYASVSARDPWMPYIGASLRGPNRLIHYSPQEKTILWQANVDSLVQEMERDTGSPVAGFQDSAEDADGNAYFIAAFGNAILKVDPDGNATQFYSPERPATTYGFGGAFVTGDNVLVVADAVSRAFVRFELSGPAPSHPTVAAPRGHRGGGVLECDALVAPPRYRDRVCLCSAVVDRALSPHGAIAAYQSEDGWRTSRFAGAIPVEFGQAPDVWSTAQLATADRVYALSSALPYDESLAFPRTGSTTLVDITDKIDALVGELARGADRSDDGAGHDHEQL
ncbi:hypothetical protein PG996_013595 [Apiospora saccharicola]|uniref:Uncharacterized protein n=1 Tax=Apiospora saccharicola TaxID=335842 RepID=A0ABR1U5W9_9PEZI